MTALTIANLYLAYRQAKTALYYERRGVGLIELAEFEKKLATNLTRLGLKLAGEAWFSNLDIGEVWVVPKRLELPAPASNRLIHIGCDREPSPRSLDVQVRLSPSPEFAIAEILFLWEFGAQLESLLSSESIGYRLDLRRGALSPYRRWIFEYWPHRYQEFRTHPLKIAKAELSSRRTSLAIVSADLANFYDSIDPRFLLSERFLDRAKDSGLDLQAFLKATESLIDAFDRFYQTASRRLGTRVTRGIPIGSLTSRVIANVALATLDAHVRSIPNVLTYRRYVDDIAIVASAESEVSQAQVLEALFPIASTTDDIIHLDSSILDRQGSELKLQTRKLKVHHLCNESGIDFVEAVLADFGRLVSRSEAFLDTTALLRDGAMHLFRANDGAGSPLRVLREADRTRLEQFEFSISIRTLERASILVSTDEARTMVRRTLERVGRVLDGQEDWVDNLEVSFRLLRLAAATDDWPSAKELNDRMESIFGNIEALKEKVGFLRFCGGTIEAPDLAWEWLRNYLHARRVEAVASAIRVSTDTSSLHSWLPRGLTFRAGSFGAQWLRRRAAQLAQADLRSYDREDDSLTSKPSGKSGSWMEPDLSDHPELAKRFSLIREFVNRCRTHGDLAWVMPPARLFLCTRPPSYFDIARRMLYRAGTTGFSKNVFIELLNLVNAIRGTDYRDPIGDVRNDHTVHLHWTTHDDNGPIPLESQNPRLILGNLTVPLAFWGQAATGRPVLTTKRLGAVNRILTQATLAARRTDPAGLVPPALMVLPELSLPRRWFRAVASYITRHGGFGAVVGLEYLTLKHGYVVNQAYGVFPGPFGSVATWPWTKLRPAHVERLELAASGLSFRPVARDARTVVVETSWGRFATLICSELIEARRVADLLGRSELVLCPAWNQDISSYDHLIQSVGFQLHAIIAIANNGFYSDCRSWAPHAERWRRDLCRLVERNVDDIVSVILPLQSLQRFHRTPLVHKHQEWKPLPPNWPPRNN